MSNSTVYLVGAGPGDPSLITARGLELIKSADCIIYDYLVGPGLLEFAGVDCELIYVGKKAGAHTLSQDKINQLLVQKAKNYRRVVRLKGGDPFIFGRGAEEALCLREKKIDFEVVPGVSSAIAVPAYAGISLTQRTLTSTVGFITGHEDPLKDDSRLDWQALSRALGTMVFLMGVSRLDFIVKKLMSSGLARDTPVAVIRRGTTARQKTVTGNLSNIVAEVKKNGLTPPAIIVVGRVVDLRKKLNWFEKRPLFGKRIMVTRARHQAGILTRRLAAEGAEVIEIPVIKMVSLNADKKAAQALLHSRYDWVFFSSQNGVTEFAAILKRLGKDCRIFGQAKICAIGSETARALVEEVGVIADYLPLRFCAESILEHFKKLEFRGQSALILRAKQARDILPDGLRQAGLAVKVIDLYDSCLVSESATKIKEALKEKVDMVTFTSSSTVKNFIKLTGRDYRRKLAGVKLASIGQVTSDTLKEYGLGVDIEAKVFTIKGLTEAIVKFKVKSKKSKVKRKNQN